MFGYSITSLAISTDLQVVRPWWNEALVSIFNVHGCVTYARDIFEMNFPRQIRDVLSKSRAMPMSELPCFILQFNPTFMCSCLFCNLARLEFGWSDGRKDHEHNGMDYVGIMKYQVEPAQFDLVYEHRHPPTRMISPF